ncbi:hypothetical protein ACL58G_15875 [Massilia sp. GER05]|uniref:hypothetical protein n=1 Tax=unclassified Massilia TaxID=2609279 RepID=UPI0039A49B10
MNLPNFDSSQPYRAWAAGVAAGSTGAALIVKRRTTQVEVAPACPQASIVTVAGFGAACRDAVAAADAASLPARPVAPPQAPSNVVAAAAPAALNNRLRRSKEIFVSLDMLSPPSMGRC